MRRRRSILDEVASRYAEAVAAGDFERAEGWFAVARFAAQRQADRRDRSGAQPNSAKLSQTQKGSDGSVGAEVGQQDR